MRSGNEHNTFNIWWALPLAVLLFSLLLTGGSYWFIDHQSAKAQEKLEEGEELALKGKFDSALHHFDEAIELSYQFPAAKQNKQYMELAIKIESLLDEAKYQISKKEYQEALKVIDQAESQLKNMDGELVRNLIENIVTLRNKAKLYQIQDNVEQDSSISYLKSVLWQIEDIQNDEAQSMASSVQEQIISHAFSNANKHLKQNQFSEARSYVEEGLRFAPESKKLQSLRTTIEKEKTAFETAQQNRIEQAMVAAEEEQKKNKNDAVEVATIKATLDDQNHLVVQGKLKSVATVPINSVSLSYNLLNSEGEIMETNEVYVYPDTLYPDETGQFEFTHYDVEQVLKVKISKVKWFLH
ncbi:MULTISPECIES: zinc ribbon domain-containing protein [Pontibacillus]|uniref:Zinc ribbon domain-containing protein n=1 Tax=Pontibacillus chungwhensis TaxID=265426 RepID=A0ABY8V4I6_9BACI|nr:MULTISPECIES: zinc ribbon domain-containing protein [Pontibacillus]MCD5322479.1 zinc ribbon domain-containing protein [Pontibacillus sp. HN14]WIF99764.1 zinc ribbon domain-containing protein [Pontibacillus chungwhensis]